MVGEVIVGRARGNRAGADQGERRERARMVEHGHLGDHPADADAREVRRPPAEREPELTGVMASARAVFSRYYPSAGGI